MFHYLDPKEDGNFFSGPTTLVYTLNSATRACSPHRPGPGFAICDVAAMKRNAKKHPRLWLSALPLACWAPAAFVIPHRRDFVRMAAGGTQWWCQPGGINRKLQDCFQENMQADAVPLLKDYDTYTASLPVRERGFETFEVVSTPVLRQGL